MGESLRKFRKRFPDTEATVSVPDELLLVPMDAILIEQVLANLMENAVMHARGATGIEIIVARESAGACFCVRDDGAGIDKAVLPRLFEELFPHESEGDGRRSLGIGLSACMSIVRAHGGSMSAKNRPEGGAQVSFVLPMEEE